MSLITDISPLLEISLVDRIEWIMIVAWASVGSVIALVFIHRSQHGLQQKLVSARLSQTMLEYWVEDKHRDFARMVELVYNSKVEEGDPYIGNYLSIWEEIAVFCNEGTITKTHAKEFFGPDLQAIRDNRVVYEYLKEMHNTKITYNNLWKLIQKRTTAPDLRD